MNAISPGNTLPVYRLRLGFRRGWGASAGVIALCAALIACGPHNGKTDVGALRKDPAVVVIVDNEPIFMSDVQLEAEAQNLVKKGETLTPDAPIFTRVLEELIDQKLLARAAIENKLDATPDARFQLQAARERILGNLLVSNLVGAKVTEESIKRLYREQIRDMKLGEETRCRHIMVSSEAEALAVKAQLERGTDFSTLAYQRSLDASTRLDGGDLGFVSVDSLAPPFAQAVQKTPVGKISTPFKTDAGWHVVLVEEKRTQAPPTLEEMRPEIVKFMLFDQIQSQLKKLREKATIDRKDLPAGERIIDANPVEQSEAPAGFTPPASAPEALGDQAVPKPKIVAPRLGSDGAATGPIVTDESAPSAPLSRALPPASVGSKPPAKPAAAPSAAKPPATGASSSEGASAGQ